MRTFTQQLSKITLCLWASALLTTTAIAQEMMLNPTATVVYGTSSDIPEFICPGIDTLQLIEEDSLSSLEDNDFVRLAKGFELNISTSNSGTWETIGDYNVWRYKVTSYYAYSMNVLLEDINIPENASIFIYDDDMSYVVGPIQYSVNQYGVYHSEFIPGSSIIVEVVVYGEIDPTVPYLTITGVSHDYNDFVGYTMGKDNTRFSKRIRNCADKDVNCSLGTGWQTHKRSVALMVMKSKTLFVIPNDLYAGTGALINNTNFDGKSLFLTARHCVSSNARAKELIFYFNHESNGCGENKEHPYNFSVSGATVLSTNAHTDFTLLELHGKVLSSYYPYLAGWDKRAGGKLYKHLGNKGKKYRKRIHSKDNRGIIINRIDISKRPKVVDNKERIGDLEIDLVIGKDHKGALLTINDRATGLLFMGKIDSKESKAVTDKTIELLEEWKPLLHTITSDNGKEFANHREISEKLDIDYYFAKPYHSWERGANENLNGLVRQYFPKKTNFEAITQEQINKVVNILNNRPRKRFDYKTPNEVFAQKLNENINVALIT